MQLFQICPDRRKNRKILKYKGFVKKEAKDCLFYLLCFVFGSTPKVFSPIKKASIKDCDINLKKKQINLTSESLQ